MRKRTKKILISLIILVVTLHVVAFIWLAVNSRDIPAPDTSDLAIVKMNVSNENNAYIYFKQARQLFDYTDQESDQVKSILDNETWDNEFVTGLISKNSEALNLLKRGLTCPVYQKPEQAQPEKFKSLVKSVKMAELMALKTMQERQTKQTEKALESCRDLVRFSSLIIENPGSLIEYIIGVPILKLGLNEHRQLLNETSLTESQLISLSENLKNVSSLDEGLIRAIKVDFHLVSEMILNFDTEFLNDDSISNSKKHRLFRRYCFHPNRTKKQYADVCRDVIKNASLPYKELSLPEVDLSSSELKTLQKLRPNSLARLLLPYTGFFNSPLRGRHKPQAQLTAIRLVVACRLYEMKYGHLPETLENLVPLFFDDVPCDPFDSEPFRYLPKQAIVYSVGKDLKDLTDSEKIVDMAISRNNKKDKNTNDLIYNIHKKIEYITPADVP